MSTLRFDSEDIALTEEFLSEAYTKMRIGGRAENTRARVTRDSVGSTSVDRLAFDYDMSHDAQPLGKVCICTVRSGTIVRRYAGGAEGSFGAGDAFLYAPHDRPYTGVVRGAHCDLVMFDPALLDQVAAALPGSGPRQVRLTGDRPVSPAAVRHLQATVTYLCDHVLTVPEVRDEPLIASSASRLLATSTLNAFPSNALTDPGCQDRRDARPATLHRAVAFIEDHADTDIGAADIAAAARVSLRALQLSFQRHLDTTPTAYLRRVRLAHAHRELLAAGRETGATVTRTAARWGFLHPGRFAADYRRAYGCSPRQTLGRPPP